MKKFLAFLITLILFLTFIPFTNAGGASLSIYPQSGSFTVGSTFNVSIFLNTGGNDVNTVKVDLKFDPQKLQVVTPAKGLSAVSEWVFPPTFSNTRGTITFQGGFPAGINTSEGLVSVIVFQAKSTGRAAINFLGSSKVFLADERGTNILTSTNRGIYDILPVPPKGLPIFSETHPDQNKWYKNPNPTFSWQKIGGVEGFSFKLDDDPFGEPDNVIDTSSNSQFFDNIEDGVWYFHLKAKKGGAWGGTSHFKANIDTTPPSLFKPRPESFGPVLGNYLLINFNTTDLLSGVDHYEVRMIDISDPENITFSGFYREDSPCRLITERPGSFRVLVRAFDRAGNYREEGVKVKVISPGLVIVTGGIQLKGVFIPWWLIILILIILIAGGGLTFWRIKMRDVRKRLEKEVEEVEEKLEDIEKLKEEARKRPSSKKRVREIWKRIKERIGKRGFKKLKIKIEK